MEASSQRGGGGGPWSHPKDRSYSKETQEMLKLMMQECRLSNPQRKRIIDSLQNGTALPLPLDPKPQHPLQPKSGKPMTNRWMLGRPQRRCAEDCRSGDNYSRDMFRPGPRRDLDKEKKKLQNLMATGEEDPPLPTPRHLKIEPIEHIDTFQEVLNEIEERRQFLADMAALGQEQKYINIINTEIALKIKELELLDKSYSKKKESRGERKEEVDSGGNSRRL